MSLFQTMDSGNFLQRPGAASGGKQARGSTADSTKVRVSALLVPVRNLILVKIVNVTTVLWVQTDDDSGSAAQVQSDSGSSDEDPDVSDCSGERFESAHEPGWEASLLSFWHGKLAWTRIAECDQPDSRIQLSSGFEPTTSRQLKLPF